MQDAIPTEAFDATANSILTSHSQLKNTLPTAVAQLRPLLAVLPCSDAAGQVRPRPRGQPLLPSEEAMRQAADLVAAAATFAPAAESQVGGQSPAVAWWNLHHAQWLPCPISMSCDWLLPMAVRSMYGSMSA
jgi:hypothetical protein